VLITLGKVEMLPQFLRRGLCFRNDVNMITVTVEGTCGAARLSL
jgi:hypothetical protein